MFAIRTRKMDARRIYLLMSAGSSLFFTLVFSVNMVYQVQTVGLTPLQLVLVGTLLESSVLLFEVPTGIVADVYSRRLSMVIGYVLIGAGFIVEGAFPVFGAVLLSQVLWGIGYTFTSGANEAWITDEVGEAQNGAIFMRASQIGNLLGIGGTVIAIVLGSLLINLPIVLGGLLFIALAVFLILFMPETGFHPTPAENRSTWGQMLHTLRGGLRVIRGRPVLMAILGIGLFYGLYSEGFDRLSTDHMLTSFTLPDFGGLQPVAWMGIIAMIGKFLSVVVMHLVERRLDMKNGQALARALWIVSGLLIASLLGFALAGSFALVVVMSWCVSILRTVGNPIETTWINQHIDSNVRATVISMRGQVDAIGQIAGGPPVGLIGDTFGVRAALVASSLILSPVLYLYARVLRRGASAVPAPVPAD
jgi:MFS transporter, DHA3 family, tetracycline resistance protein